MSQLTQWSWVRNSLYEHLYCTWHLILQLGMVMMNSFWDITIILRGSNDHALSLAWMETKAALFLSSAEFSFLESCPKTLSLWTINSIQVELDISSHSVSLPLLAPSYLQICCFMLTILRYINYISTSVLHSLSAWPYIPFTICSLHFQWNPPCLVITFLVSDQLPTVQYFPSMNTVKSEVFSTGAYFGQLLCFFIFVI